MNTVPLGKTKGLSLVTDFICFKKIASQRFFLQQLFSFQYWLQAQTLSISQLSVVLCAGLRPHELYPIYITMSLLVILVQFVQEIILVRLQTSKHFQESKSHSTFHNPYPFATSSVIIPEPEVQELCQLQMYQLELGFTTLILIGCCSYNCLHLLPRNQS